MSTFTIPVPATTASRTYKDKAFYGIERPGFDRLMILPAIGAVIAPEDGYYHIVGVDPVHGLVIPRGISPSQSAGDLAAFYDTGKSTIHEFSTLKELMLWALSSL